MPGDDLLGAVDLLEQHDTRQHVGPGQLAEAEYQVSPFADFVRMAIGSTQQESHIAHTVILPAAQPVGELLAGQVLAAFITHHHTRTFGQGGQQGRTFAGLCGGFGFKFFEGEGPGQAARIFSAQIGYRAAGAAYGQSRDTHVRSGVSALFAVDMLGRPQLLELVERTHFGAEQMDDDVAGIEQNPVAL